ncbi:MAG: GlcG/HbpS family heme-binding protein [Panacagrimonas sp.]
MSNSPISVAQRVIDWRAASSAVHAAAAAAEANGWRINIAVVDRSGVLAGFLRMPGAPLHSVEIAIDKAYTAASFGLATGRWSEALKQHSEAVREGITKRPRFVAFGGGLPIVADGELIGGIGVSGGTEHQDEDCARAGLKSIGVES